MVVELDYTDVDTGDQATSCNLTTVNNGSITTACICSAGTCTVGITPSSNSTANVTSTFRVNDGDTNSNYSNLTVTVTSVNDAPAGTNKTVTTNEDVNYVFSASDFGFTD